MALTYDKIIEILKSKKHRLTDIRLAIIDIFVKNEHMTFSELLGELEKRFNNVNLMSVYNTIDLLLVEHILFTNTFDGKQVYYDLVENPSYHMVCDVCKKIVHLQKESVDGMVNLDEIKKPITDASWSPIHFKIEGHGICDDCQDTNQLEHNHYEDDLD